VRQIFLEGGAFPFTNAQAHIKEAMDIIIKSVKEELEEEGFDLSKPIEIYRSLNSFKHIFIQEE